MADKQEKISFEEALGQLEQVVQSLEDGELGLNESLEEYQRGVDLLKQCHATLEDVQRKVELLTGVTDGNPETQLIDDSEMDLDEKQASRSQRRTGNSADETAEAESGDVDDSDTLF